MRSRGSGTWYEVVGTKRFSRSCRFEFDTLEEAQKHVARISAKGSNLFGYVFVITERT